MADQQKILSYGMKIRHLIGLHWSHDTSLPLATRNRSEIVFIFVGK